MIKSIFKYLLIFFVSIVIVYQFQGTISKLRLIPTGILKLVFPEVKVKPSIDKEIFNAKTEIINANSFEIYINEIDYFSGYNKDEDGNMYAQHKSSALYGSKSKNDTFLELYTRDGFLITKDSVKKFDLPKYYDSHNSQGGIRGIFFIDDETYAYMATKKIGCQNMSLINLNRNIEIFDTDCLPDFQGIHYDGVGGASIHNKKNILLSVGAPTNNTQSIRDLAQDDDSFYGKIISINKDNVRNYLSGNDKIKTKIFTKGHRNPQGLAKIDNTFFSAEHGPKGGDEINLLQENNNYGWPIASYGTKYESISVASYKLNHSKNSFQEPLMQFTPSIAISDLTNCSEIMKKYYERKGCLIGTTLKDKSLIILLLSEDLNRVIGYEKIEFDQRLRHIAKKKNGELFSENDGSIYVTSDSGVVLKVTFKLTKE
jgi:hypothetical protein|tara:strand:+ start:4333 stop:5616 length:1284 start_codon:yes stop_codon:yes gene_type:complete